MISRRHALGAGGLALLLAACTPPPPPRIVPEDGTIDLVSLLRSKPEHTRYVNALVISGATARIGRQHGAVTLFAPTNDTLAGLPAPLLALLDNPPAQPTEAQRQQVSAIVFANAAYGSLRLADITVRRNTVVTWDRASLVVMTTGERSATMARQGATPVAAGAPRASIVRGNVLASDGILHVTNGFVMP